MREGVHVPVHPMLFLPIEFAQRDIELTSGHMVADRSCYFHPLVMSNNTSFIKLQHGHEKAMHKNAEAV